MNPVAVAAATSYAFTLGLVAAINPCGFPLLPAYLALFAGDPGGLRTTRTARGLLSGAGVTCGFVAVFGTLGLVLVSGAALASGWLPWFMVTAGVLMAVLGLSTLCGHPLYLRLPTPRLAPGGRTFTATFVFGIAYAIGSLSCALPLFLAAVGGSFTQLGFWAGLACYLAYALGMGLFVTAAAVVTATARSGILQSFRTAGRFLPRFSGAVLVVSGIYLACYWAADLLNFPLTGGPFAAVGAAQAALTAFLAGHLAATAAILLAAVLAGIAVVVRKTWTSPGKTPGAEHSEGTPPCLKRPRRPARQTPQAGPTPEAGRSCGARAGSCS
ncbi:cytochrome c biogenesis CcdA family protein [Arthrobacter wenxiniae]|uniref:Cytochrome c biogenesis protein CcdA n=1 Tax=Arthrobacter wenxiniae TaxID=2713570 RepID=A0A7Y7LZW3_9MICC|nr:cytochrome c biogenesis CcdA family protein [Arthrobacter wenxiniae]NVM96955.1 cytochrome c biogenesis protein CcdA [Arthrobacter wenxiniae]